MKIAIHNRPGSFSDRWINYCNENKISYKLVNCYDFNIMSEIKDCNGLLWHWNQNDYRALNFARQFVCAVENLGIKVFPDSNTCWHFDDKIAQKYLLEAIGAPLVKSYTFFDEESALKWINETSFPKVFKLRGGAGSINVQLVNSRFKARKLTKRAFGKGFPFANKLSGLKDRFWKFQRDRNLKALVHILKGFIRLIYPPKNSNLFPRQKGYLYFQDFIPNNVFDDRIVIIGNRAIAIRRQNRTNDFRASGSGLIHHDHTLFNLDTIRIAFDVTEKIKSQSMAFDFIYDEKGLPHIVEISYTYIQGPSYDHCPGFWDKELNWHEDNVNPQKYIIEDFLNSIRNA